MRKLEKIPPDEHLTDSNQNFVTVGQKKKVENKNDWNCNNFHYKDIYSENIENQWPLISLEVSVLVSLYKFYQVQTTLSGKPRVIPIQATRRWGYSGSCPPANWQLNQQTKSVCKKVHHTSKN